MFRSTLAAAACAGAFALVTVLSVPASATATPPTPCEVATTDLATAQQAAEKADSRVERDRRTLDDLSVFTQRLTVAQKAYDTVNADPTSTDAAKATALGNLNRAKADLASAHTRDDAPVADLPAARDNAAAKRETVTDKRSVAERVCVGHPVPYYPTCDAVHAAGITVLLRRNHDGYRVALDTDRDGIACETPEGPPPSSQTPPPSDITIVNPPPQGDTTIVNPAPVPPVVSGDLPVTH